MATQWAVTPTTWTSAESVNNPIQCIQQTESGTKKYFYVFGLSFA